MKKSDRQKRNATSSFPGSNSGIGRMHCLLSGQYDFGEKDETFRPRSRIFSFSWLCCLWVLSIACFSGSSFAATRYVWTNSPSPGSGFLTWSTAAHTIQDAIDAAASNDVVLVTNGVYATGCRYPGGRATRVVIAAKITVQSVNGPSNTIIKGRGPQDNPSAIRCAYLSHGAVLVGFTLTNGCTEALTNNFGYGAGVYCASSAEVVSNCTITGNSAYWHGGGAYRGTLRNCTLSGNATCYGGGADQSVLYDCTLTGNKANFFGGGALDSTLNNCTLINNTAGYTTGGYNIGGGGGVSGGMLSNCTLTSNSAIRDGGGSWNSTLLNCIVSSNSASGSGGGSFGGVCSNSAINGNDCGSSGGGAYGATLYNSSLNGNSSQNGGGAGNSIIVNCLIRGNNANMSGGGAYGGTLNNCAIVSNAVVQSASWAVSGGGASYAVLNNCTVVGNVAPASWDPWHGNISYYGGVDNCTLRNSLIYYNVNGNYDDASTLAYCCTWPFVPGSGNFTNDPGLVAISNPRLTAGSACIDAGNSDFVQTSSDLDGNTRTSGVTVDVGCYEFSSGGTTGALSAAIIVLPSTNTSVGYPLSFQAVIGGHSTSYTWQFGDGNVATNKCLVTHSYDNVGTYPVVLRATNLNASISATVAVHVVSLDAATRYVATNGNDAATGMSWITAKATIQAGISAAPACGVVLVSNGVYATGGSAWGSRVTITNGVTVRSINGPDVTTIMGGATNGIRCAYVRDGSAIAGFTLTGGNTASYGGGGGILFDSPQGTASNCIVAFNVAQLWGGGSFNGTLYDSTLVGNVAGFGGGAALSTLNHCLLDGNEAMQGGGAAYATLSGCTLSNNDASLAFFGDSSPTAGGGAWRSRLFKCLITGNSTTNTPQGYHGYGGGTSDSILYNCTLSFNRACYGGGASDGSLYDCLVVNNFAAKGGGGVAEMSPTSTFRNCTIHGNSAGTWGGGAMEGSLVNCIVYDNTAPDGANYRWSTCSSTCTTPMPAGAGNITNAPQFVSMEDMHLLSNSPCINAGDNSNVFTPCDLDGTSRVQGGAVDMGAYESPFAEPYIRLMGDLAFGNVPTGQVAMKTLSIVNPGNTMLNVTNIGYPAGFSGARTGIVAAGKTASIKVSFVPTTVKAYGGSIIASSSGQSWTSSLTCSGSGVSVSRAIGLTGDLAYGDIIVGQTATRILTITNSGNALLTVTNIAYPACFSGSWTGAVAPRSSANVTVSFTPTLAQSYTGTITVSSDSTSGTPTITCSGRGLSDVAIHHYVWAPISSPKDLGVAFPVTITAQDATSNTVSSFNNAVEIRGSAHGIVSANIYQSSFNNYGSFVSSKTAGYSFTPNVDITVTHIRHYCGIKVSLWTDTGTLLMSKALVSNPGVWVETPLDSPVTLSAGACYRVGLYASNEYSYHGTTGSSDFPDGTINQAYYAYGDVFPAQTSSDRWPMVDLTYRVNGIVGSFPVSPSRSGYFVGGVATVSVSVLQLMTNMWLTAVDSDGHSGDSDEFAVEVSKVLNLAGNLAFGNVVTGQTATATMTISNSGNSALTVAGIDYPDGFTGAWIGSIEAGSSTNVTVTFAPMALATYSGAVTVNSDKTSGENTIVISGTGAVWRPAPQGDARFGVISNRFGFNINWTSGRVVVVDASTNLTQTNWIPLVTGTLSGVPYYFFDSKWTNHIGRFYRIRSQ